jgi:hypothetical protein
VDLEGLPAGVVEAAGRLGGHIERHAEVLALLLARGRQQPQPHAQPGAALDLLHAPAQHVQGVGRAPGAHQNLIAHVQPQVAGRVGGRLDPDEPAVLLGDPALAARLVGLQHQQRGLPAFQRHPVGWDHASAPSMISRVTTSVFGLISP